MKKKSFIIVIGLFIVLGMFLLNGEINGNKNKDFPLPFLADVKPEETEEEIEDEESDEQIDEAEPVIDHVKELIVEAVQSTIEFFSQDTNIVAVGDSLTQGVGDSSGDGGYVGMLDQTINEQKQLVEFTNLGRSGHRTDQLSKRLDDPQISESIAEADIVLITIGANDIMQVVKENFTNLKMEQFTREQVRFEDRLKIIIDKIKKINPNTHIYLLGIYNPFKQYFEDVEELDQIVGEWNQTVEVVTSEYENTSFIPIKDIFDDTDTHLFADDNFHPNDQGYERMAERVLDYLTNEGRRTP